MNMPHFSLRPVAALLFAAFSTSAFADLGGGLEGVILRMSLTVSQEGSPQPYNKADLDKFLMVAPDGSLGFDPAKAPPAGSSWALAQVDSHNELTWTSPTTSSISSDLSIRVSGNVDPYMNYGFSARNTSLMDQTYTFSIGESILPPVTPGSHFDLSSSLGLSLTHAPSSAATLGLAPGAAFVQTLKLSTDGGATYFASQGIGSATTNSTPSNTQVYSFGPDTLSLINANASSINFWLIETKFTLTGKSSAGLSGDVGINPTFVAIPETSTYAALMGSAGLLVVLRRRFAVRATRG
jgi:hypothetical protein